jgi:hypothetical protein
MGSRSEQFSADLHQRTAQTYASSIVRDVARIAKCPRAGVLDHSCSDPKLHQFAFDTLARAEIISSLKGELTTDAVFLREATALK